MSQSGRFMRVKLHGPRRFKTDRQRKVNGPWMKKWTDHTAKTGRVTKAKGPETWAKVGGLESQLQMVKIGCFYPKPERESKVSIELDRIFEWNLSILYRIIQCIVSTTDRRTVWWDQAIDCLSLCVRTDSGPWFWLDCLENLHLKL